MKRFVLVLLIVLPYGQLFSQEKYPFAVAPLKFNILYVGVDNPVDIAVSDAKKEEIRVTVTNGTIRKTGNISYVIKPKAVGVCRVSVFNGDTAVGIKEFRCKLVPDPTAFVADHIYGGRILKNVLAAQFGVSSELSNFDFDLKFTVVSFSLTVQEGDQFTTEKSASNKFTAMQKQLIHNASINTSVIIDNIKCVGPDGVIRDLNSVILTLK